jgi:TRAP-type C4-dicarboxylate transport system substrate-binding protein
MKSTIHAAVFLIALLGTPLFSQTITINMGTVAPEGSLWHQILTRMKEDWGKASGGKVVLRVFAGGRQGDESQMLREVRQGTTLHAVALSGAGLAQVDNSVNALHIPLMMNSYAELDYVRKQIEPRLERAIEAKNLVVLNWSDVGWVYFFTKKEARTLDDIRTLKLFTTAGDPDTEQLYKGLRFKPVPSGAEELLTNLQTGFIEAFYVPPLFALANQSFGIAKFMIDMKWSPLIGATLISRGAWEKVPANLRPELLRIARNAGDEFRTKILSSGDEAIVEMAKKQLQIIKLSDAEMAKWRAETSAAYPKMKEKLVPADLFDEVERLLKEFRARK